MPSLNVLQDVLLITLRLIWSLGEFISNVHLYMFSSMFRVCKMQYAFFNQFLLVFLLNLHTETVVLCSHRIIMHYLEIATRWLPSSKLFSELLSLSFRTWLESAVWRVEYWLYSLWILPRLHSFSGTKSSIYNAFCWITPLFGILAAALHGRFYV